MKTNRTTETQTDAHLAAKYANEARERVNGSIALFARMNEEERLLFLVGILRNHPEDLFPALFDLGENILEARELRASLGGK